MHIPNILQAAASPRSLQRHAPSDTGVRIVKRIYPMTESPLALL
jgi:hypothetical protein